MKITVGIVEDEIKEKERTEEMLRRFFSEEGIPYETLCFSDGEELFRKSLSDIDLLLLDIILPTENGIEIARKVRESGWKGPLIFITKTIQFAIDGYKVEALDYLLKPLEYEDFRLKLSKAYQIINSLLDKPITFKANEGLVTLEESEIYYIEVIKHYLTIHSIKGSYTIRGTMNSMSEQLSSRFANSSNSFLVNLDHVDLIKNTEVIVNGEIIPLSRNFKKDFLRLFAERRG